MKKTFFFALFVAIVSQYGFSQFFIGGGLSYQHTSSKISDNSSDSDLIEISPLLGYRFDKADIGLLFLYQSETSSSSSDEMNNIGFGAFGSYKFFTVDRFSISGRASIQYINSKYTSEYDTGFPYYISYTMEQNINSIGISIAPIFEYKLFERFTLYASIGSISYFHSWGEITGSSSYPTLEISLDSFKVTLSTGISLGFYIFFFLCFKWSMNNAYILLWKY
jgi:hypothetical protein